MLTTLDPAATTEAPTTEADRQAAANFRANRTALWQTQPSLAERLVPPPLETQWLFARDGSLTGQTCDGQWWADCSVPLLAGRALLKTLEPATHHSCLLAPPHAGLLRAACEQVGDDAALMVIVPDAATLPMLLACDDFAARLAAHRLWIVAGADWADQFRTLLIDNPGLSTPARFIRCKLIDEATSAPLIDAAQTVFAEVLASRTARLASLREQPPVPRHDLLLIAGSTYRLWDHAGQTLAEMLGVEDTFGSIHRLDTDDPAHSSPLQLALAAADARAIVAANLSRADAPGLVDPAKPWLTWITRPGVPPIAAAGPQDALIFTDPSWRDAAARAGWPADRLAVAGWPVAAVERPVPSTPLLALLADTIAIESPAHVDDLSSHRLLWDAVLEELTFTPLVVGTDLVGYLHDRARAHHLALEAVDQRAFLDGLISPAVVQGVARLLLAANLPVRLFGRGWSELPEFQPHTAGAILSRAAFAGAVDQATALVHPFPSVGVHPMDTAGRPVLRCCTGRTAAATVADARRLIGLRTTPSSPASHSDLRATLKQLLRKF